MSSAHLIEDYIEAQSLNEADEIDLESFKQVIEDRLLQIDEQPAYADKLIQKGEAGDLMDPELELKNALDEIGRNEKEI